MLQQFLSKKSTAGIAMVLIVAMIAAPALAMAESGPGNIPVKQEAQKGCADGERQAESDISGGTWFAIGCLAGLIGYVISLSEPNPPATKLLGKSPEYVAAYTDCYRQKGKKIKSKNALTGCLVGTGATVALYAIAIAAASGNTTY